MKRDIQLHPGSRAPRAPARKPVIKRFGLAVMFGVVVPIASSPAASFDCGKARSDRERTICSNPGLSQTDERLDAAYVADLAKLSPGGKVALRDEERAWLRSLDASCLPPPVKARAAAGYRTACLVEAFGKRQVILARAVFSAGPYVFRVHHEEAVFGPAPGSGPGFGFGVRVDYPQVDGTTDPGLLAWNASVARTPRDVGRCGSGFTAASYRVTVDFATATAVAIHVRNTRMGCPVSSARGEVVSGVIGVADGDSVAVVRPAFRSLGGTALFRPGADWRHFLGAKVDAGARAVAASLRCDPAAIPLLDVLAEDSTRWRFSAVGLYVAFAPGDLGPRCVMSTAPTVTWKELTPYLDPAFGAPLVPG